MTAARRLRFFLSILSWHNLFLNHLSQSEPSIRTPRLLATSTGYFFPSTAARHFPYNSSSCTAYSSGFDAEPVP